MLLAARCKYGTQKSRQKSPSGHHRTTLSGYIFATKARIDNRKNVVGRPWRGRPWRIERWDVLSQQMLTVAAIKHVVHGISLL